VGTEARDEIGCAFERLGVTQIAGFDATLVVFARAYRNRNGVAQKIER